MNIFVNQAGYLLQGEKRAAMPFECRDFWLEDAEGKICFRGQTKEFGFDRSSGDQVWEADFSEFCEEGTYRVCAEKEGEKEISACFQIGDGAYDKLMYDLMKAYYFMRCGTKLEAKYAGKFVHNACHLGLAKEWVNHDKELEVCGGWHDAGDYGRYITAGACALSHLLYAYKMFPETFGALELNIPESGNGVPDVLNECRYELEWFLKLQREDGGVYHKATTARHAAFVMPEEDLEQLYALPVSSMATADFAAICAMAAEIYLPFDEVFAEKLEAAAKKSYNWLKANPEFLGFKNPEGCGTGEYGEGNDDSNRFWAAAELYSLTGEKKYHEDMVKALEKPFPKAALGYGEVGGFGLLSYLLTGQETDQELTERFLEIFVQETAQRVLVAESCGYGVSMMEFEYFWGSNMGVMKHGMTFAIADYFGLEERVKAAVDTAQYPKRWRRPGEPEDTEQIERTRMARGWSMRDHVAAQLDYLMGLNALGISYVTGNGENAYNYPHLRPAHADGIEECMPGMVSGGPSGHPADPVGRELVPEGTPPMKGYVDHWMSYSLNEITIYWNSPAVFVAAYLLNLLK